MVHTSARERTQSITHQAQREVRTCRLDNRQQKEHGVPPWVLFDRLRVHRCVTTVTGGRTRPGQERARALFQTRTEYQPNNDHKRLAPSATASTISVLSRVPLNRKKLPSMRRRITKNRSTFRMLKKTRKLPYSSATTEHTIDRPCDFRGRGCWEPHCCVAYSEYAGRLTPPCTRRTRTSGT